MDFKEVTGLLAFIVSFISILGLVSLVKKNKGDKCYSVIKWLSAGIVFAVFLHALAEMLHAFGMISEDALLTIMASLIAIGSMCFILAIPNE